MKDVFDGKPDARQITDEKPSPYNTLFRKRYRALTDAELVLHDAIKDKADELARLMGSLSPGVYARLVGNKPEAVMAGVGEKDPAQVGLALRHLEDAVYRAVKALTA